MIVFHRVFEGKIFDKNAMNESIIERLRDEQCINVALILISISKKIWWIWLIVGDYCSLCRYECLIISILIDV